MADTTIDKLKIEVESEAKNAASTIDDLTDKLGKLSASIGKLDVSKLNSLKTALHDLGSIKVGNSVNEVQKLNSSIDKLANSAAKNLSKNLIEKFNIADKNVQQDVKDMSAQLMKLSAAMSLKFDESTYKKANDTMVNLCSTIGREAREGVGKAEESYKEFYDYVSSHEKIYVDIKTRQDDNWKEIAQTIPTKFTKASGNHQDLASYYQGLSEKFPQICSPDITDTTMQLKAIADGLREYRDQMQGVNQASKYGEEAFNANQREAIHDTSAAMGSLTESLQKYLGVAKESDIPNAYQKAVDSANANGSESLTGFSDIASSLSNITRVAKNLPVDDLTTLESHIKNIITNAQGFEAVSNLAESVSKLSASLATIPNMSNFSRFADGLTKLNGAKTDNFAEIAGSLDQLAASAKSLTESGIENVKLNVSGGTVRAQSTDNLSNDNGIWEYTGKIEGLEEETEKLESKTQEMGEAVSQAFQKATESTNALANGITLVGLSIPDLMDALESGDAANYIENIRIALDRAQEGLANAQNALSAGENAGLGQDQLSRYMTEIDQYEVKIDILKDKLAELGVADGMQQADQNINQYGQDAQDAANGIGQASQANIDFLNTSLRLNSIQGVFSGIKGAADGLHSVFNGLRSAVNSITSAVQKVGSAVKSAFNGMKSAVETTVSATKKLVSAFSAIANPVSTFKKLTGASNDAGKSFSQTGKHLLKLVGYAVGVRSLYFLFRKMRSVMKDSFDNLAQYSDEVNQNLSTLTADLNQVKNSLSTAFAPILNVVVPILDTLLSYLAAAITAIGQFFAALTGSSTYTKATKVATDYAASLDSTGSSASGASDAVDDLNGELQGFNELNNISVDDGSDSGSGSGSGNGSSSSSDLFTTEEVTSEYADFAEKIKEAWENADFTEIGQIIGEKLRDALNSIDWDAIQEVAEKIGKSVATLINGFIETSGLDTIVGETVGELVNTGIAGADAFFTALHWDSLGDFIADALNAAVATVDWAGLGQTIADYLNGIFTLTATWTGRLDFGALGDSVAIAIDTALSGINWDTVIAAANNIGSGVADALNGVITENTFAEIGITLGSIINTVVESASSFIDSASWGVWGEAIARGIFDAVMYADFTEIGTTIANAVNGALTFVSTLTGTSQLDTICDSIATGLNNALSGIDSDSFTTTASNIGSAIATALNSVMTVETFGNIGEAVSTAVNGVFALAETWANKFNFDEAGKAIATAINNTISGVTWSEKITTASKIGSGIATALNGVITTDTFANVGTTLAGILNTVVSGAYALMSETNFKQLASDIVGGINNFLATTDFEKLGATIGTIIQNAIDSVSTFISELDKSEVKKAIVDFMEGVAENVDMSTVAAIIAAVLAASLATSIASETVTVVSKALEKTLAESLATSFTATIASAGGLTAALGEIGAALETAASACAPVVAAVAAISAILVDLYNTSETFRDTVTSAFEKVKESLDTALSGISESLSGLISAFSELASAAYECYSNSPIKALIELIASLAASLAGSVISTAITAIGDAFSGIIDTITNVVGIFTSLFEILNGLFTLDFSAVKEGFMDLGSSIYSTLESIVTTMAEVGIDIITGLYNGIVEAATGVATWINENIVQPFVNAIKNLFGVHSPSTVMAEIGNFLIEGLLGGIVDALTNIGTWVNNHIIQPIKDALADFSLSDAIEIGVSLVKNGWDTVTGWLSNLGSDIVSGVAEIAVELKKSATNWVSDAWTALQSAGQTATSTVQAAVQKASTWVNDAWTAIQTGAGTVTRTLKGAVEKASTWVNDAWTAATATTGNVTRTLKGAVEKASTWVNDAWTAATATTGNVTRTLKGAVEKASTWVSDAWTAATATTGNVTRTLKGAVEKASTWVDDAWTAATKTAGTVVRGIKSTVEKGSTWVDDAWTAATKAAGTIVRAVKSTVEKGSTWVSDAWTAATKTAGTVVRGIKSTVEKGSTWVADAWTAANKVAGTIVRDVKATVQKGSTWVADAWTAVCKAAGTTARTLQQSVKKGTSWVADAWTAACKAAGTVSRTLKQSVKKGSSWSSDAFTALKATGGTVKRTIEVTAKKVGTAWKAIGSLLGFEAKGGILVNGSWQSIPQYASGTTNAALHGSLFVAGEAGAELVGHIGGQTEVLNQSQLAATMKSAIIGGLAELVPSLQAIYTHMSACTNALIGAQISTAGYTLADVTTGCADFYSTDSEIEQIISNSVSNGVDNVADSKAYADKMDKMLNALYKISDAVESGNSVTVEVEGDSAGMFKIIQKEARNFTKRTGNLAFV